MKVKYLKIKFMEGDTNLLRSIVRLGFKALDLFELIMFMTEGNIFVSGGTNKEDIMKKLKISEPTYYKRIQMLKDEGLLKQVTRGVYTVNSKYVEIVIDSKGRYGNFKR